MENNEERNDVLEAFEQISANEHEPQLIEKYLHYVEEEVHRHLDGCLAVGLTMTGQEKETFDWWRQRGRIIATQTTQALITVLRRELIGDNN